MMEPKVTCYENSSAIATANDDNLVEHSTHIRKERNIVDAVEAAPFGHKTNSNLDLSTPLPEKLGSDNEDLRKWQILEGLKDGQRFEEKPVKLCGFMLKRRKRPLKGWHKRYFCLENGILSYSKSINDMNKGKFHGSIDVGISVISTKTSSRRIDIDSDTSIFHLKVKRDVEEFNQWVSALRNHRLARQHDLYYGNQAISCDSDCDKSFSISRSQFSLKTDDLSPELYLTNYSESKVIKDNLFMLQEKLVKLSSLLKFIEVENACSNLDIENLKFKKPRRKFYYLRKKKHVNNKNSDCYNNNYLRSDSITLKDQNYLSVSHPSLSDECLHQNNENNSKSLSKVQAMNDFVRLANEVNNDFRKTMKVFQEESQNIELSDKNITHKSFPNGICENKEPTYRRNMSIYSQDDSSVLSISEYYDAQDKMTPSDYNSSSSEEDDDESIITEFSEDGVNSHATNKVDRPNMIIRRTKLPSVQPSNDISLWSLLYKNIGKDLSKISMPVTLNEPLNVLQRLCEELEYCELLDLASTIEDPYQRMLLIAAFAVSSYSSLYYRAGHKPFNPLLGETYECVREDKGFRFISEQVSHHPPVSACHADSRNYVFWQDLRVKTKFWGKSMEIIPFGTVNVLLKSHNCHYKWNKITTCVHNLFKGERYVDNYGELIIKDNNNITCKITFEKASYWSNKANEINGFVLNPKGEVVEKIFGKWNESIHSGSRCIWRPGSMPDNHHLYYGFTRFAIELNELNKADSQCLPPTDTRFRPDQRLLEEGNISKAESVKMELEQAQRERRKLREEQSLPEFIPLWFRKQMESSEETYCYSNNYWQAKENKFTGIDFIQLW